MLELAEVVGLEEHLTVTSRGHGHLVDLWIAIKRSSVGLEWEKQFSSIAQKANARLSPHGFFEALPFSERRGWIVARCADYNVISRRAVEDIVRALVAEANERIPIPTPVAVRRPRIIGQRESWTHRVRTIVAGGSALVLGDNFTERRERDIDIASG